MSSNQTRFLIIQGSLLEGIYGGVMVIVQENELDEHSSNSR